MLKSRRMETARDLIEHHLLIQMGNKFEEELFMDEESLENPIDYFKAVFDDEMTQLVADETNLYYVQCDVAKGCIGTMEIEI